MGPKCSFVKFYSNQQPGRLGLGENFAFRTTRPPRNTPSYTETGQCLIAIVAFRDIRQTDR